MDIFQTILIAIIEGLTEFLPISSTAHIGFIGSLLGVELNEFLKIFQISIQFGAILSVVFVYRHKFFNFSNFNFYLKLFFGVIPALIFGKLFNDIIEIFLENIISMAIILILGGIVLLFVDKFFQNTTINNEKNITVKQSIAIGLWQCLAILLPGTSRSAASIIGGMTQGLTRKAAAEFSFFLAVPTMLAATLYSIFLKNWGENQQKGYEIIMASNENITNFLIGNIISFLVATIAIKTFIGILNKYGFRFWGYYRIVVGTLLLLYFII